MNHPHKRTALGAAVLTAGLMATAVPPPTPTR